VVLSPPEVAAILDRMSGPPALAASLMYACGLRLMEVLQLRIKDIDFDRKRSPCGAARDRRIAGPC
jgi:integrase